MPFFKESDEGRAVWGRGFPQKSENHGLACRKARHCHDPSGRLLSRLVHSGIRPFWTNPRLKPTTVLVLDYDVGVEIAVEVYKLKVRMAYDFNSVGNSERKPAQGQPA